MEFYPIDKKVEQQFQEISKRIFRLQNGRSLDSMERIGADTRGQIGASYLSLKNLAEQYQKDSRLATRLWGTKKREEQIVACFLFSPEELNTEKITQLLHHCYGTEIAEYIGTLVLSKRKDLVERIEEYLNSENALLQTAALTAIGRNLIECKSNSPFTDSYMQQINPNKFGDSHVRTIYNRVYIPMQRK